ncbi:MULTISPECIES: hypothetical protein [unclassified Ochrobactrum]|uniref:hypothetical protein n=1 Tax=unclassified Ochrobactrum TaxID=239106 RepID=UPI0025702B0E|nr:MULTISPECIES: hypothetical protein [unclassified Ochrobactrum]
MAASLLSSYRVELTNLPVVGDVENILNVVQSHGAKISGTPHSTTITATDLMAPAGPSLREA